jgi:hypothetical protein
MTPLFSLSCVQVILCGVRPGAGRTQIEQALRMCDARAVSRPEDPSDLDNVLVINGQRDGARSREVQALVARGAHIIDRDLFDAYVRGATTLYRAQERTQERHADRTRATALRAQWQASPYRAAF